MDNYDSPADSLNPILRTRLEDLSGHRITGATPVGGGYTPALRLRLVLDDGSTRFAKIGTSQRIARWLRTEYRIYSEIAAPFLARCLGWEDDPDAPILLLEDLSALHWPPPWRDGDAEAVMQTLARVAMVEPPPDLPRLEAFTDVFDGWERIAADPEPFLSLDLADAAWLERVLPRLLEIDPTGNLTGGSLLHLDVRSDNLCLDGRRVVLVDWNHAAVGNPDFDIAFWLPSLEMEGGPAPDVLLPRAGELAAIVCGYFASRAGLPEIPGVPGVRELQRVQLASALPWMVRALDLPAPDRVN